jgi:hypothetical protein
LKKSVDGKLTAHKILFECFGTQVRFCCFWRFAVIWTLNVLFLAHFLIGNSSRPTDPPGPTIEALACTRPQQHEATSSLDSTTSHYQKKNVFKE